LRFVALAITRPVVQILNIIGGHFSLSRNFYKDFNKEGIVLVRMQILLSNPKALER
jgi:hypothetical protein